MHAVFVLSLSCQINKVFEYLANLSRSFMVRSAAHDPGPPPSCVCVCVVFFTVVAETCVEVLPAFNLLHTDCSMRNINA